MPVAPRRNNAQHQPLTTVLRNIIREYPAGGGVLRELCQNADDAGATRVVFVLDTTTHELHNILHKDLAEYQGPALLAYNNSTFSAVDFDSLSKIGESAKATDPNSTGKFGRGFNSVYNWTDMPSILSGDSLLILDPHFTWSREVSPGDPGGPVYEFTESFGDPDMQGQLTAFGSILKNFQNTFEGTIVRLPLRTEAQALKSKIVPDKSTSEKEIIDVFELFSSELVESLLFLRNVHSITLRIGEDIYAKAESTPGTSHRYHETKDIINKGYSDVFVKKERDLCEEDFLTYISLYRGEAADNYKTGKKEKFKYAISHHMRRSVKNEQLQEWANSQKLFPWIAIATPLEGGTNFTGRLFTTLPLPIQTKHPVHIHGMFSITPDRSNIHSGGDRTSSENSETKLGARWNASLFKECLPHTWIRNLKFLDLMNKNKETKFTGWDFWPAGIQGKERELWMGVLGTLFEQVVEQDLKLLPTVCGNTGARNDVLFTLNIDEKYKSALQHAGSPISFPPKDRRPELETLGIEALGLTRLNPTSARISLSKLKGSLENLNPDSRAILLEYILSDRNYQHIGSCRAPLLPISNGKFRSFNINPDEPKLYFPHTEDEAELFRESTTMVNTKKLIPNTKQQMVSDIKKLDRFTAISIWRVADAALYCKKYIFNTIESQRDDIITMPDFNGFVNLFWKWINSIENISQLSANPHLLKDLWLIPTLGGRYHKILDGKSPILDISGRGFTGAFLQNTASSLFKRYGISYTLYAGDREGFTRATTDVLRTRHYVQNCEIFSSLVSWLVANSKDFVDRLDDTEKTTLINRLSLLSKGLSNKSGAKILQKLSLFQEVAPAADAANRPWISLESIVNNGPVNYIGIRGVPVVLHASNTIFIDISNIDSDQLVRGLGLAVCPSLEEILELYIVPNIVDTSDDALRDSLVEFALKKFAHLSQSSKDTLSCTAIVPVNTTKTILRRPVDTVSLELMIFFFPDEHRTPIQKFYSSYHLELTILKMATKMSGEFVLERITTYSQSNHLPNEIGEKARKLLDRLCPIAAIPQEYLSLRWIPAQPLGGGGVEELYSAEQCRDLKSEPFVKYAMPVIKSYVSESWREAMGWNKPLQKPQLLAQLDGAVKAGDPTALRDLVMNGGKNLIDCTPELQELEWIPDKDGAKYYRPSDIFFDDFSPLSPYIGTVAPEFKKWSLKEFITNLGVKKEPSFSQLKELQDKLAAKGVLTGTDLEAALFIVKEVGRRFSEEELGDFKAPDDSGCLRLLKYLTAGDPGPEAYKDITGSDPVDQAERAILHPGVPEVTIKQLRLPTFHARLLEFLNDPDFEDDFSQRESSVTVIKDTLNRYTPSSTFNEYLANAEDCGSAKTISWILDHTESYSGTRLLVDKLQEVQGPALFCYNDGRFTKEDFKAVIDIGVGSKRGDYSKIGKFGRGALTMYHWTSVPSFISDDSFVIFDPEQKYLPPHPITRKARTGIKLKLKDMRQKYPDQLRPFEGIFGFDQHTTSFPGTIFRFPLRSIPSKQLGGSNFDSGRTPRQFLMDYYKSAIESLLFLRNIESISFREIIPPTDPTQGPVQEKSPEELVWVVSSERDLVNIPRDARIKELTIKGRITMMPDAGGSKKSSAKWCVISGRKAEDDLSDALVKIQMQDRLEAKYGLAALISKTGNLRGRNYMSLPLIKPGAMEIPVHVDANLVVQSNRQSIPLADSEMEEGSVWNKWIFEMGVAPLYLVLIKHLMQTRGADGYRYWPPYPSEKSDIISQIISTEFWKRVASTPYELYPPDLPLTSISEVPANLDFKTATFNLLNPTDSEFLMEILRRFGLYDIVSPPQRIRDDLKAYSPDSMKSLSPEYLLDLLRSTTHQKKLSQIWNEKDRNIEFFNKLLSFILSGDIPGESGEPTTFGYETIAPGSLIGCELLPLTNDTLGRFLSKAAATPNFLIAKTLEERMILNVSPTLAVHHDLEPSTIQRLMSTSELNIENFHFSDIPGVHKIMNQKSGGHNTDERKDWIRKVWSYFELCVRESPEKQEYYLNILNDIPVYFGTPIGQPDTHTEFISPAQFSSGSAPVILQQSGLTTPQNLVIQSLEGLILLDPSAFPQLHLPSELMGSVSGARGVYRLLQSIQSLADKLDLSVEQYLIKTLQPSNLEALRGLLDPTMMGYLLKSYPESTPYLKQLPIWPSESKQLSSYKSATEAMLAPDYDISFTGLTGDEPFIQASVAGNYNNELITLGVKKISLDNLLTNNVRQGEKIERNKIASYRSFVTSLYRRNPSAFSKHPLAINGNGEHCMIKSLYDHKHPIFVAAFRDKKTSFLHPDLRALDIWQNTGLRLQPTESLYLDCVGSIEMRRKEASPIEDDQLIADARAVFEYLSWDNQEMQSWNSGTWNILHQIPAVPVQTEFGGSPEYRKPQMRIVLRGSNFTTFSKAVTPEYISIAWSQCPVLKNKLGSFVLTRVPGGGAPSIETVLNHLRFLSENRHFVAQQEIRAYVADTKASYQHLQDRISTLPPPDRKAEIWFNVDAADVNGMDQNTFRNAWACSEELCSGLSSDSSQIKYVRTFLIPFADLLDHYGVEKHVPPDTLSLPVEPTNYPALILATIQRFRKEGKLLDIPLQLEVENTMLGAHRIVLAAASTYWETALTSGFEESEKRIIPLHELKARTVAAVLDYIYTGDVSGVSPSADPSDTLQDLIYQLELSDLWHLDDLKVKLEYQICRKDLDLIRPESVQAILEQAKSTRATSLSQVCEKYISRNRQIVLRENTQN